MEDFPSQDSHLAARPRLQGLQHGSGDIVRVAPNSLSFVTPQSYLDIYGHTTQGKKRFLKNRWYEQGETRINTARDPAVHTEQRKALSHAFSARALRDQETVVNQYIDLLLEQLVKTGMNGKKPVNVTAIWNWLTFDIIGELIFLILQSPSIFPTAMTSCRVDSNIRGR